MARESLDASSASFPACVQSHAQGYACPHMRATRRRMGTHTGTLGRTSGRMWERMGALWASTIASGHKWAHRLCVHTHARTRPYARPVTPTRMTLTRFARGHALSLAHKAKPHAQDRDRMYLCANGLRIMGDHTQHADTQALPRTHYGRTVAHLGAKVGVGGSPCVSGNFRRKLGFWEGSHNRPRSRLRTHIQAHGRKPVGFHFVQK